MCLNLVREGTFKSVEHRLFLTESADLLQLVFCYVRSMLGVIVI
jgi:hypothetical protein